MYRLNSSTPIPDSPGSSSTGGISLAEISDATRRAESFARAAWAKQQRNDRAGAVTAYNDAAAAVEPSDPRRHWRLLVPVKNNLASIHSAEGRVEDAETCYIQAINLLETCDGQQNEAELASLYSNLAVLYARIGLAEAAMKMQERALSLLDHARAPHTRARYHALRTMETICHRAGRDDLIPGLAKQREQLSAMLCGE